MDFQLDDGIAVLRRTPGTLAALLRGLPDGWTRSTEGTDTWSAYDIVGHLLHGEEDNWIARARMILDYGDGRPFAPFNRTAMFTKYDDYSLDQLLDAFEQARAHSLETLDALAMTPEKLALTGTHPALGTVTLAHRFELAAFAWDTQETRHILAMLRHGIDGVYCDRVDRMVAAVGEWR